MNRTYLKLKDNSMIVHTQFPEKFEGSTPSNEKEYRNYHIGKLREILPYGSKLFMLQRSQTDYSASYSVFVILDDEVVDMTYRVLKTCGFRRTSKGHLQVKGSGTDLSLQVAMQAGLTLYDDANAFKSIKL